MKAYRLNRQFNVKSKRSLNVALLRDGEMPEEVAKHLPWLVDCVDLPLKPPSFSAYWNFLQTMIGLIKKIFGTRNDREVAKIRNSLVPSVSAFSEEVKALSDDELRTKTKAWQEELKDIEEDDQLAYRLEEIKSEAFAVV